VADRVEFRGTLTHDELVPLYRSAWALLAPSKVLANGRRDGIPNVVIEAMAMGVPCIGTTTGGLDEVVRPGETGALVPVSDPPALAAAIERLVRDPAGLDRMGQAALQLVVREFDFERNFERFRALLGPARAQGEPALPSRGAA
jgi:glycosyltransferase involved in cell wall biosynthesis